MTCARPSPPRWPSSNARTVRPATDQDHRRTQPRVRPRSPGERMRRMAAPSASATRPPTPSTTTDRTPLPSPPHPPRVGFLWFHADNEQLRQPATWEFGAPAEFRSPYPLIKSQLLFRLSYGGRYSIITQRGRGLIGPPLRAVWRRAPGCRPEWSGSKSAASTPAPCAGRRRPQAAWWHTSGAGSAASR